MSSGITDLGILRDISPREAWPDEARHLTPWLHENLDRLGEAVGMQLEAQGREVAVETFAADILARNLADDSLVLIENQLERSDHCHLGQILTYAAGLDARTVIWVAPGFRAPHLSALKWLNDHTGEGISFFAVRVRVVRIGESQPAPIFEVVSRPDNWARELTAVAESRRSESQRGTFRREFWEHLLARHPEEAAYQEANAASSRWSVLDDIDVVIVQYVARASVGVFIRGRRGEAAGNLLQRLRPHVPALEAALGTTIGDEGSDHFFVSSQKADTADRSCWDTAADWLSANRKRYETALRDIMGTRV